MNKQCERGNAARGFPRECRFCIEAGSSCNSSLACLNASRPHYMPMDNLMELVLLVHQNKERILMTRPEQSGTGHAMPRISHVEPTGRGRLPSFNPSLPDYHRQLMLLEQQNQKRLSMTWQPANCRGPVSSHPQQLSVSSHTPPRADISHDHEEQPSAPK